MNISYSLDQYADTCRDAIKKSSAKLNESFENLLVEILLLYMIIPRKINFTQMGRFSNHCEQTFHSNFNRKKSGSCCLLFPHFCLYISFTFCS